MGESKKPKRPRSAKGRTLPPDAKSLEAMMLALTREIEQKVLHLQAEPHDTLARAGFKRLFQDRAAAFGRLREMDPTRADRFAQDHNFNAGGAP